jgi:hypothetical protein
MSDPSKSQSPVQSPVLGLHCTSCGAPWPSPEPPVSYAPDGTIKMHVPECACGATPAHWSAGEGG